MTRILALLWRLGHQARFHRVLTYTTFDRGWGYYCLACDTLVKAAWR